MKSMTFEVLPFGPCLVCLEAMVDPERGHQAFHRDLGGERAIWGLYCEHSRAGAYTFVTPHQDVQWHITSPIEMEDFVMRTAAVADAFVARLATSGGEPH